MPERWTINGRFLEQPITGVQRYAREVLIGLDALLHAGHPAAKLLCIDLVQPRAAFDVPTLTEIEVRTTQDGLFGHTWEQCILPRQARGRLLNLCNTAPLLPKGQVTCIHDMNIRQVPESYSLSFRTLYSLLLPLVARRSSIVTTVSEYSAAKLSDYGVCPREKIRIVSGGHEHVARWRTETCGAARKREIGKNTVFAFGSPAKHKNLSILLSIADQLHNEGIEIAIAGDLDSNVFSSQPGVSAHSNVRWLGRVSDEELGEILASCLCLAFPSIEEGFGLPPLEAMALGCPVVAAQSASIPEVCGDAALYASPFTSSEWLGAILRLFHDVTLREEMKQRGQSRIQTYTWRTASGAYLEILSMLSGSSRELG